MLRFDDETVRLAYLTRTQLSEALNTSIDGECARLSEGRCLSSEESAVIDPGQKEVEGDERTLAELAALDAEADSTVKKLMSTSLLASGSADSTGGTDTMVQASQGVDVELQALRLIPRATLEMMLVQALDRVRHRNSLQRGGYGASLFGPRLGAEYDELVDVLSRRKAAQTQKAAADAAKKGNVLEGETLTVRIDGKDSERKGTHLLKGDIFLLSDGELCPCDAILVEASPKGSHHQLPPGSGTKRTVGRTVLISMPSVTGTHRRWQRAFGGKTSDCPFFGTTNLIPGGSTVHLDERAEAILVAISDPNSSAVSQMESRAKSIAPNQGGTFPAFFPSGISPAIRMNSRHACARAASITALMLDAEGLCWDDRHLTVSSILAGGTHFHCSSLDRAWNFAGSLADHNPASSISQEYKSVAGSLGIGHFSVNSLGLSGDGGGSRITPSSPMALLRRMALLSSLACLNTHATLPSIDSTTTEGLGTVANFGSSWIGSPSYVALDRWLCDASENTKHMLQSELNRFKALSPRLDIPANFFASAMALVGEKPSALPVYAQLLQYDVPMTAQAQRGALLLLWGSSVDVMALSTFYYDSRGQVPIPKAALRAQREASHGEDTIETVGFALADLPPSSIAMLHSNRPPSAEPIQPADILHLLASSQSLCFVGTMCLGPTVQYQNINALSLAVGVGESVGLSSDQSVEVGTTAGLLSGATVGPIDYRSSLATALILTASPMRVVEGVLTSARRYNSASAGDASLLTKTQVSLADGSSQSVLSVSQRRVIDGNVAICSDPAEAQCLLDELNVASGVDSSAVKVVWVCNTRSDDERKELVLSLKKQLHPVGVDQNQTHPMGVVGFLGSNLLSVSAMRSSDVPLVALVHQHSSAAQSTEATAHPTKHVIFYDSPLFTEGTELVLSRPTTAGQSPTDSHQRQGVHAEAASSIMLSELFSLMAEGKEFLAKKEAHH